MLIAGNNRVEIEKLKQSLHKKFAMKELRQTRHILGMWIEQNRKTKTLRLSQSNYIQKVMKRFDMENVTPASASDDNSTIGQRLFIHRRGEEAQWKDTLRISRRKYNLRNGGDPFGPRTCRRGCQPVHVKPKTEALGGHQAHP